MRRCLLALSALFFAGCGTSPCEALLTQSVAESLVGQTLTGDGQTLDGYCSRRYSLADTSQGNLLDHARIEIYHGDVMGRRGHFAGSAKTAGEKPFTAIQVVEHPHVEVVLALATAGEDLRKAAGDAFVQGQRRRADALIRNPNGAPVGLSVSEGLTALPRNYHEIFLFRAEVPSMAVIASYLVDAIPKEKIAAEAKRLADAMSER